MNPITALSRIPADKLGHIVAGQLIFSACHLAQINSLLCLGAVVIIGVAKEVVHDWMLKRGTPDAWDALATVFGGLLGYAVTIRF
jgi:hypothetical protein